MLGGGVHGDVLGAGAAQGANATRYEAGTMASSYECIIYIVATLSILIFPSSNPTLPQLYLHPPGPPGAPTKDDAREEFSKATRQLSEATQEVSSATKELVKDRWLGTTRADVKRGDIPSD